MEKPFSESEFRQQAILALCHRPSTGSHQNGYLEATAIHDAATHLTEIEVRMLKQAGLVVTS